VKAFLHSIRSTIVVILKEIVFKTNPGSLEEVAEIFILLMIERPRHYIDNRNAYLRMMEN